MKLKKKIDRYKLGRWMQYLTYFIAGICLALVVLRTGYIFKKVIDVNEAITLYYTGKWLEAEEAVSEAKRNDWFHYKEKELTEISQELQWVTKYRTKLKELSERLTNCDEKRDYDAFKKELAVYEGLGLSSLEEWQRECLLEKYPIETIIHYCWYDFKEEMTETLSHPLEHEDYNLAKVNIFDVPRIFFEGDKRQEIEKLFTQCDLQLLEAYKEKEWDFDKLIGAINEIYVVNDECGFESYWLNDKVKNYINSEVKAAARPLDEKLLELVKEGNEKYSDAMSRKLFEAEDEEIEEVPHSEDVREQKENVSNLIKQAEGDIENFIKVVKCYKQQENKPYYSAEVQNIITQYIKLKEDEIDCLIQGRFFREAGDWYDAMTYFKDYEKELARLECIKAYVAPWSLLDLPVEYPVYQAGLLTDKSGKYLVAFNDQDETVYLFNVTGSQEDNIINKISVKFSDIDLSSAMLNKIEKIEVQGGLILLSLRDGSLSRVMVLEQKEESLVLLFDKEGTNISYLDGLKTISVENPKDEAIPNIYTYIYEAGNYKKEDEKPHEVELTNSNLLTYMGQQITFTCYVPVSGEGNPAIGYSYTADGYEEASIVQLNLAGEAKLESGFYQIIGKVVGSITYYDEMTEMNVDRPIVEVTQVEKQEEIE